jgi:hypothetical protein
MSTRMRFPLASGDIVMASVVIWSRVSRRLALKAGKDQETGG